MSTLSLCCTSLEPNHPHADFLTLCPVVERHASVVFRALPIAEREEAVAEAMASAFESYLSLKQRGRDCVLEFPSKMAKYAALHVKNDRHVGGHANSHDALSAKAQQKHGFRVDSLQRTLPRRRKARHAFGRSSRILDAFEEHLQDDSLTPIPEQVCFRLDWAAFMRTLSRRDRAMAKYLSLGNSATETAEKFRMSCGRVTQLRRRWHREWTTFQGEMQPADVSLKS
ncbi:MAG: hypothetical protein HY040_21875 [Planctomycetes bacterium]|nr:hypothetical protein [Planctomycetota bacterium]